MLEIFASVAVKKVRLAARDRPTRTIPSKSPVTIIDPVGSKAAAETRFE
jgi:hypothetical protein